jgi:predicted NAD/FAD-binding protein
MKLTRRQCLVGGASALLEGAMRMGATGLAGVPGLGALSACTRRDDSRLPADVQGAWVGAHLERGHALRDGRWPDAAGQAGQAVRVHTLIIGAGVAGLSAARVLMQAGLDDFAVLDMEDDMGGNARGHRMQGLPCPLGAHYLPVPGPDDAPEVAQWLEEIGVIRRAQGRWVGDERHLCHSPQERVFVPEGEPEAPRVWWPGQWHEGLMPHAALGPDDEAQFQRFHADVARARKEIGFAMPTTQAPWHGGHAALDALTFAQWLDQRGYTSPALRWWADYACRDDYGAGAARVSAWAGLHYFASRHGDDEAEPVPVLTWPQGNAWLIEQLAQGLGSRWQAGQVVLRIEPGRDDVQVRTWSPLKQQARHWVARQLIVAVPLFIAQRLLSMPLSPLQAVMPRMAYAPWLVSNLLIDTPFQDRSGAALSWDNVAYTAQGIEQGSLDLSGVPSLGYVNARHQSMAPPTGPMLLTHYWALGGQHAAQGLALRQALLQSGADWRPWADRVAADLARIHPELPGRVQRIDLMRYGHAMSIPVPGLRGHAGLAALCTPQGQGRLHFAHSDLSAYSVFEEAFTHGVRAAHQVLSAVGMQRRMA